MKEKKFGARTFRVGLVLATDAIKLQVKLLKLLGPAVDRLPTIMAGMGERGEKDEAAKAASDAAAISALTDVFGKADPNETATLLGEIVSLSQVAVKSGSWEKVDLDQDFSGENMKHLFPVCVFVVQEVLGDFFGAALAGGSPRAVLKGS